MNEQRPCRIEGCDRPRCPARSLCNYHRGRRDRYGDPLAEPPPRPTAVERFAKYVREGDVSSHALRLGPCLLWIGSRTEDGYGQLWVDGRLVKAHRFAWEQAHGPIPDNLTLDHLCRIRNCIQVAEHLELVTMRENVLRGTGPAALNARKTECPFCGGPYSIRKDGWRRCRPCANEYQRAYNAARRQVGTQQEEEETA